VLAVTVIADDLTGAADCGTAFAVAGLPTFVAFGQRPWPTSAMVVACDTDTRRLPPDEAAARALTAVREAYRQGSNAVYRKIDSTLRGNVGVEIAASWRAAAERSQLAPLVVACPAFPATGRLVRLGQVLVGGVPLERTELWQTSGMTGPADLPSMLRGAGLVVATIPADEVRDGAGPLGRRLSALAEGGVQAVVCDAEDEQDLQRIAEAGARVVPPVLWAGSAGLARKLPAALRLRAPGDANAPLDEPAEGPVLVAVGSRSSVARQQADAVAADAGVVTLIAPPSVLLVGPDQAGWTRLSSSLRAALTAGRDVLLMTGMETLLALERGPVLAAQLARLVAAEAGRLAGLVVTGGDVARAMLEAVGANGLHLLGEVEPGVPLGVTDTERALRVVTKAGGFGSPNALRHARAALHRRR